jgi:hypothetical protein
MPNPAVLATIQVYGDPMSMALPAGPLPTHPTLGTAAAAAIMAEVPANTRRVIFEICGGMASPTSCEMEYEARYDAAYWGGSAFMSHLMMRDFDDVAFVKEGLFDEAVPLFDDTVGGTMEEWTVINHTFTDHPFHIHVNPFLVTHVNGIALAVPEWRDTILVPGVDAPGGGDINTFTPGSVKFRTRFDARFPGHFVMHCHILSHEDVGMMQLVEVTSPP